MRLATVMEHMSSTEESKRMRGMSIPRTLTRDAERQNVSVWMMRGSRESSESVESSGEATPHGTLTMDTAMTRLCKSTSLTR